MIPKDYIKFTKLTQKALTFQPEILEIRESRET